MRHIVRNNTVRKQTIFYRAKAALSCNFSPFFCENSVNFAQQARCVPSLKRGTRPQAGFYVKKIDLHAK